MADMTDMTDSIRPFYADWAGYNRRIAEALRRLTAEELALQVPGSDHWPIWAVAGHAAGTRVYWLCDFLGEPGAETTPFTNAAHAGWEDDLDTPRTGEELAEAYAATWRIVEACLTRWTPAMLSEAFGRERETGPQLHTRQSVLLRILNHDAYHVGEISLTLGANGREPINLWPQADWSADAPRSRREG